MEKNRFIKMYILSVFVSVSIGFFLGYVLNPSLSNYVDFIGDVLNFSSILTGFLGAVMGIMASISKSSTIMTQLLKHKKAKRQFIYSMLIPFVVGLSNIVICMGFKLVLANNLNKEITMWCNALFLISSIFFVITGIAMTYFIFTIYFKDEENSKVSKKKPEFKGIF